MINAMKLAVFVLGWMIPLICFALPEKTISTDDLRQGPVALDGLWAFDWQELHINMSAPMRDGLLLPGLWHKQGPYAPQGFGTLRLSVNMPKRQPYYLRIPDVPSAMSLWVNGQLRFKRGVVSNDAQTEQAKFGPDVVRLEPAEQYDLILQVSNFHHKEGGVWHNLLIADDDHRHALRDQSKLLDAMVFSLLMLISVYLLARNTSKYGHTSHVFFALFVWAVALRSVMVGERIIYDFITVVSWENWQRLEHILLFFSLPMFIYFFYRFFEIKNIFYPHMIAFLSFVLIILTLFLPAVSFTQFGLASQIMVLFTIIYMLIMLALLIKQNKPFSILFSVSFFGWTLLVMHDYLYTNLYIQSRPLAQFGLVFFVIFQMYLLWQHSKRESRLLMHVKASIDRSTHYLESKYKTSSHDACFVLNDWFSAIELYCDVLNLPIYMEDGSLSVCCEAGQLQDVVLVLARMAERDGIQASLYVGRDAKSVRFEFIFNKVIHNQEMLHDELNSVHHLLNDMETLLIIERLSTTTKMSFTLPIFELKSALQGVEEKPAIEYFGNNLAEPILFASDYQELIITSLSDYFYLIKASITTENIEKYRPKLIVWQVKKWNGYILEDMKRIQKEHSSVPIILVVDGYNKTQLAQCIRMGITDYVVSPVLPEELLLKVQRVHNVNTVVMPNSQDLRDVTVQLVRDSIAMWQKYSGKSKIELAENSRLWRVYMDGSTAKTRTLDKYLSLQTLPKNPRWETVNRTVHYVLEQCSLDEKDKLLLNQQLSMFNRLLAS
jgi:CheY-like chemotaxis protein